MKISTSVRHLKFHINTRPVRHNYYIRTQSAGLFWILFKFYTCISKPDINHDDEGEDAIRKYWQPTLKYISKQFKGLYVNFTKFDNKIYWQHDPGI